MKEVVVVVAAEEVELVMVVRYEVMEMEEEVTGVLVVKDEVPWTEEEAVFGVMFWRWCWWCWWRRLFGCW